MENYQSEKVSEPLYKKEYKLKDDLKLTLRNPNSKDAQALIDQMKMVDSETKFLAREPDEFNLTLEQEKNFIESTLKNENMLFLVGEIDGNIIANCSVGRVSKNRRYLHRAAMGIAICKEYWRKGIGKIMMQECIQWCREKDIEQLELEVVTKNERAVSMYQSLGFEIYGTKKHALKYSDGTYADEYYMILFLNSADDK